MSAIKVLLVDDEVDFTAGMKRVLSSRGFDVKEARNGLVALSLVGEEQFDVVVLDIKMPGMDGIQVLAEIKRLSPDIPVILLTGHYDLCDDEDAWKARAYACVFKPCPIMKLVEVITAAAAGDKSGTKVSAAGEGSPTYINSR
jgi:DNA-binding NtrC family response regulator